MMRSEYMHWAKTRSQARFTLAVSGMPNLPISELPFSTDELELTNTDSYGYAPLREAISARSGVTPGHVVSAAGTSMANHLAMATLVEPGDEVIVESPVYEPIVAVAQYLGAIVKFVPRRLENRFAIDPDDVARLVGSRTRLIVLTNLHNPTGAWIDSDTLVRIGEVAARAGAHVLVDEVYLDGVFDPAVLSAVHLGPQFVSTNSLTKLYGLSGLRCGWILAQPELADRMWGLNDLFGVNAAHPAERLSVVAFRQLDRLLEGANALIETNRRVWQEFAASRTELEVPEIGSGTTVFPKLHGKSVEELCTLLRAKYETSVVPGRFFGADDHFRVGLTCEVATFAAGIERLGAALDELASANEEQRGLSG